MNKSNLANYDIETPRLRLVCCNKEVLEHLFKGNKSLASFLQVNIPEKWTEFGEPAFKFTYEKIINGSGKIEWWSYLPVLKKTKTLLGSCGYKGDPKNGMVEIGYEVADVDFAGMPDGPYWSDDERDNAEAAIYS